MLRFFVLIVCFSGAAYAVDAGHGVAEMTGSIVDTPCSIDSGDQNQTIQLDTIPIEQINRDGMGPSKSFSIRLINCILKSEHKDGLEWGRYAITFDGPRAQNNLFKISGVATGVALEIKDINGNKAIPGQEMPMGTLVLGGTVLNYTIRLMPVPESLNPGAFWSHLRFKMEYY
jgi:type 1 fimbria pilin